MSTEIQSTQLQDQKNEAIETNLAKQRQMYERKLEQERIEKQQLAERLAALEAAAQERARKSGQHDSDDEEDNEPYVDRRKLHKELSKFQKDLELTIDQKAEAKAAALFDVERKNTFLKDNPDFNQIMSSEQTIDKFATKFPKLAENILRMPDGFERQKLVYENIKALGIDKPETKEPSIQEKIDANRRSPYYQPSGVGSPGYASQADFSPQGMKTAYEKMKALKSNLRI